MTVVYIAGSFKAAREKLEAKQVLESAGIQCLLSYKGDPKGIKGCLERIEAADVVYVVNPGGTIGKSVCLDIGYAMALRRPVYPQCPVDDPPVAELVKAPVSARDLATALGHGSAP